MEFLAIKAGNSAGFLPPVLKGMHTKGREGGGIVHAKYAKNAAFLFNFIIIRIDVINGVSVVISR